MYIHHLVHRGAIRNKTAVRGGGSPPFSAATVSNSNINCFINHKHVLFKLMNDGINRIMNNITINMSCKVSHY